MKALTTASLLAAMPPLAHERLARSAIRLDDVAALLDVHDDDIVLLAGSYATGEANLTSDLDLLVITGERAARRPPGSSNHPSIFGNSFDARIGDLVVNIEYINEARVEEVCRIIDAVGAAGGQPDLPNLQALEVRLAERISQGVVLAGSARAERLRSRIDLDAVRASVTALSFVMTMSLLEDAEHVTPVLRDFVHRSAGEGLLLSAVNAFGRITYDVKHLGSRAARLAGQDAMPQVLAQWETVVYLDRFRASATGTAVEVGARLADLAADLYGAFARPPCPALVRPMLRPFVGSWAWTGRSFE